MKNKFRKELERLDDPAYARDLSRLLESSTPQQRDEIKEQRRFVLLEAMHSVTALDIAFPVLPWLFMRGFSR